MFSSHSVAPVVDLVLLFPRLFVFLWKSSGSGRRKRHGGLLQPLPPRLELQRLGLKVKEMDSEVPGLRV